MLTDCKKEGLSPNYRKLLFMNIIGHLPLAVFLAGTVVIIYYSWWLSIKDRRYHGIWRFFAFECILALIALNMPYWFSSLFSPLQLCSWALLILSLFPAVQGYYLLRARGMPQGKFENTRSLVCEGIYRYIRHPLYCSLALVGWGVFFKNITYATLLLAIANTSALVLTAKVEEREMIARFGEEYATYMKKTKMFIPYLL
jgi:protein-S-isoprenylcysteine O-methyltransferase Ste14